MTALRLFIVALVKLGCVAGFCGLALNGLAAWAWPLLLLAVLTRFPKPVDPPAPAEDALTALRAIAQAPDTPAPIRARALEGLARASVGSSKQAA